MSELKPGDRVTYRAGRGYGEGRVANIAEGMATIATEGGKMVNRKASQLTLAAVSAAEQRPAEEGAV